MEGQLKAIDQKRAECEQSLEPLRERIGEVRLKEQEARLTEEQFARQLAEAGAREEELSAQLEKGVRASALQAEIARLAEEIRGLGAVNLAAIGGAAERARAQGLPRRAVARPDRGDRHARGRDPAHRPGNARAAATHFRRRQPIISGACSRRCSAAGTRAWC